MQMPGRGTFATTGRRLAVAAVTAGLLAAAPAGCGSPEPSPVSTGSKKPASKTPSPTPTPTKSPTPSASPGSVEEQLHAATITFYAAVTKAYKTLDPAPINAVIVPNSSAGGFYINDITTLKRKHHRLADVPEYEISKFALEPQDADPNNEIVTFKLSADYSEEVDEHGNTVEKFPAGSAEGRIEFMKKGASWLVLSQRFAE